MPEGLLSSDVARRYWDLRHQTQDDLQSGGHIGLDHAGNEVFYAVRLGRLIDVVGDRTSVREPLRVLDAGCGKGWFARSMAKFGHQVDAIDSSPAAVAEARAVGGGVRYAVSSLQDWSTPWLYDVVFAVDVLFHVLDDAEWLASVRNLASLVRFAGMLVIADEDATGRRQLGDYIVHRTRAEYVEALAPYGVRHRRYVPYGFRDNRVGFHVFLKES